MRIGCQAEMHATAGPEVLLRIRAQARRQGVNVAQRQQAGRLGLQRGCLEAPCEQSARFAAAIVYPANVAPPDRLHGATEPAGIGRCGHEPETARQQRVSMQCDVGCTQRAAKLCEQATGIVIVAYDIARCRAMRDEVRISRDRQASKPRHRESDRIDCVQPSMLADGVAVGHAGHVIGDRTRPLLFHVLLVIAR